MTCARCGNQAAWGLKAAYSDGRWEESCDQCGGSFAPVRDVYFKTRYFDEHLTHPDHPESAGGTWVESREQKHQLLKKYNLREAGDRIGGATPFDPIAHRHATESLRRNHHG